ncbi:hypothetical protein WALSEDRAFT_69012 [Wallemia mellicola CBS 633.66]|uniref:Uncharacterized protein n=2 Tax=Wallemia mellicola TaxID=1708541 RepID=I4YBU5_WALMC|nr:hypothetical protein WALSEDRAFT_69012 [Wallemia mellicola CBS 633.66]EIM21437.1 hypothetical protein WALSEDRAFT_69012 [Wallemia mellicola CBS 633.66]|eukprot:XP_006958467.1 hypothetical protein WALSEDRAFT_69012 [Wallemia mellicola CBS 633.66]
MLDHRFTRLIGIALVVIYKVYKSLFVYHQIVTAINLIMYNLLVVESIAVLAFSLDIAYLQELSETSSDLVEGDLESKAGLTVVEKITEKSSSVQTPLNVTEIETQRQMSINTLIS